MTCAIDRFSIAHHLRKQSCAINDWRLSKNAFRKAAKMHFLQLRAICAITPAGRGCGYD
jgi:hypothetical protein